jgi:hypothetical protein
MKGTPFSTEVEQSLEKTIEERLKSQMSPRINIGPAVDTKKGLKYLVPEVKDCGKGKNSDRRPFRGYVLHSYNIR